MYHLYHQQLVDMLYNNPLAAYVRQLRHKPYFRPGLYGCLVLFSVYLLYHSTYTYPQSSASLDVTEVYEPPVEVSEEVWTERANQVKLAFLHAYHGYERYALPHDELKPISSGYQDKCVFWIFHKDSS